RIGSCAYPQMYVGIIDLRGSTWADRTHGIALADRRALGDHDRAEVRQRDGKAVHRLDGDRPAVRRHGPGEADRPSRRGDHGLPSRVCTDVDAAMLAGGV